MKIVPLIVGLLVLSVIGNIFLGMHVMSKQPGESDPASVVSDAYPYLSKRIFAEDQNDILVNFVEMRRRLNDYIALSGDRVGIYFEYLPSGASIGINDRQNFAIASLLKVPLAMAALKEIENGRLSPDQHITLTDKHIDDAFGSLWKRGIGATVSLNEALELSLVESDNTAKHVLDDATSVETLANVFDSLDINKAIEGNNVVINPKSFASVFRSLYLSSYLDRKDSNYILELLTKTPFDNKIAAGVPKDINVAHKIGVYTAGPTDITYSDCGIFYYPKRPYILCIMTMGVAESESIKHMVILSNMIYNYIKAAN